MKVLNYTGLQNLWTNIKNYITVHTPTKTSDLTNDSNFVDTSNSAVASGITSAKVTSYDSHIADTDIHVTTADKTKWNNGVTQSYVFRYSGTAVVPNSTISYSTIDNTDNIKATDKIIDVDGKLFEITAVDTTNQTVTVGSALIDLALDANVMHLSGNESASGKKTFSEYITSDGSSTGDEYSNNARTNLWLMGKRDTKDVSGVLFDTFRQNTAQGTGLHILGFGIKENSVRYEGCRFSWLWDNNLSGYTFDFKPTTQGTNQAVKHNLGTSTDKWSEVHGVTYYYGSSNTEFSQKFVTTDTAQSINGNKNFVDNIIAKKIVSNVSQLQINAKTNADSVAMIGGDSASDGGGVWVYGKNTSNKSMVILQVYDTDNSTYHAVRLNMDGSLTPTVSNNGLGSSSYKWVSFNGLTPSSLGMPDLSNGVDISGYITNFGAGTVNEYTPVADGWISIANGSTDSPVFIRVYNDYGFEQVVYSERNEVGGTTGGTYTRFGALIIPCVKNVKIYIIVTPSTSVLVSAKFYPCLGNV